MSLLRTVPRHQKLLPLVVTAVVCASVPASGQEWTGSLGAAWVFQNASGNEDSFRTQLGLDEGFLLEELTVGFNGAGGVKTFSFDAWGFGNANPSERARLDLGFAGGIGLGLNYDRRRSFFDLAGSDLALRRDTWEISRWKGELSVDSWSPLSAALIVRYADRDGTVYRPMYGLNELYPVAIDVDETMAEAAIRLATRTLPVRLEFEQAFTKYERENRRTPAGSEVVIGQDPDLLEDTATNYDDDMNVATSRLTASYGNRWFEGVATLLYADPDLGAEGSGYSSFAIDGGDIGTMSFMNELVASAETENLVGAVALAFAASSRVKIRLTADYRDVSTDTTLLGTRLLHAHGPMGGALDLSTPVDETGRYDSTDEDLRLTVEYRSDRWGVWGGAFGTSRDVSWRQSSDDEAFDVSRESEGYLVGASLNLGRRLDASLEYSSGDFEEYVFRTDPDQVDRAVIKLRSQLGKGWQLDVHGIREEATNPSEVAGLDSELSPYGIGCSWTSESGDSSAGLALDRFTLETDTGLILPDGSPGRSIYETEVRMASLYGQWSGELWRLHGSATYLKDDGETWPLESWNANARIAYRGIRSTEIGLFAEYWTYDEDLADLDDYDVTRGGVFFRWSFE